MGQRNKDTAVLVFSLSARREAERKALFGKGKKQSANQFFDILIGRTQKIADGSGVDSFFIDERQQRGESFGERYANAFQQLFDQGYTKVVSIGNDAPDLTVEKLRSAIDEIQNKDLVVGPSADGGVYLLGMSRSLFDTESFLALPWLQASLFDTLMQSDYWQQGGSCSLEELTDLDDITSLIQFIHSSSDVFLTDFILTHIFLTKTNIKEWEEILFSIIPTSSLALRGPPARHFPADRALYILCP